MVLVVVVVAAILIAVQMAVAFMVVFVGMVLTARWNNVFGVDSSFTSCLRCRSNLGT